MKEVRAEAWARTKQGLASGYRLTTSIVVPIISAIISLIILWYLGVTIPITLLIGVSVAVAVYLFLLGFEFCLHLLRAPPERDAARLRRMESKEAEIERPPLRARIEAVTVHPADYNPVNKKLTVRAQAEFRNLHGPNTTIYNFQLVLAHGTGVCSDVLGSPRLLESGRAWKESFGFMFDGITEVSARLALGPHSRWKIVFKDIADNQYESEVFTKAD